MHEWNNMYPHERILSWRRFREDLDGKSLSQEEILNEVALFWAKMPRGARSLDYYTPQSWPDPWEILTYDLFCENTVSLLMYYTLKLLDTFDGNVEMCRIDSDIGEFIVPVVDGKYALNVEYATYVVVNEETGIIHTYDNKNIKDVS